VKAKFHGLARDGMIIEKLWQGMARLEKGGIAAILFKSR
jgi:hypothetical protein